MISFTLIKAKQSVTFKKPSTRLLSLLSMLITIWTYIAPSVDELRKQAEQSDAIAQTKPSVMYVLA